MTRIAAIQVNLAVDQLERVERLVAEAARAACDFVVLPELANCPWVPAREHASDRQFAEPADGPSLTAFRQMARQHRLNLIAPIYEERGGKRYSTAFVVGRDGQVVGSYRKNHIPYEYMWYEKFYYEPGDDEFPVFEHEGLRFGVLICWDNMYPETTRILALKGAQVIFAPRATGRGSLARWRTVLQANAAVNNLYVVTANRFGEDRGVLFGGDSLLVDPFGGVMGVAPDGESGLVYGEMDPAEIARSREAEPYFANRRPHLYRRIVQG